MPNPWIPATLLAVCSVAGLMVAFMRGGSLYTEIMQSDGTSFAEQLRSTPEGQIVLLNTFRVPEGEIEAFQQGWAKAADAMRLQPGFVSTTMHRPVAGSQLWVNYAVWDSAAAFTKALATPEFRAGAAFIKQASFRRLYQAEPSLGPVYKQGEVSWR